jgi:HSP20 family protein
MTLVKVNNPIAQTFDGLLNDIFNEMPSLGKNLREDAFGFPPVNITEVPNAYQIEVAVPGFEKTDFNLKLDGNLLTISADKKQDIKEENEKSIRREFSYRSFKRSFTLDEKINAANIAAKYENGVLKVTLPKKEEVKALTKEITIA